MATATALVIQMAKSAIDALVLERLQHPPPQVPREFGGECPGGHYRLRWCRPALTFPDDAPGMIRMGMAIEGGVHLASGRMLSCDAFVTATTAPDLTHDENGWYMRLTVAQIQPGTLHLDYAGHDLTTAQGLLGADLPDDALTQQLRETLTERIVQFCEEFPDIPLTYVFPTQRVAATDITVQVRPESQGGALTIAIGAPADDADAPAEASVYQDDDVTLPLMVTTAQNVAITVPTQVFVAAFAQRWADSMPYVTAASGTITTLDMQGTADSLLLSGALATPSADDTAEQVKFQLLARPVISAGAWHVDITPARDDSEDAPGEESALLAQDVGLQAALAEQMRATLAAKLARALGTATGTLTWQWYVARGATTGTIAFAPSAVSSGDGGLTLSGALPLEPDDSDLPDDGPSFDLEAVAGRADPLATAPSAAAITVRAVHQHGVTTPVDYTWQSSLTMPLAGEHGALLELRPPPTDTSTTPRHTQKLPRGIMEVTATLIDGFGRIGQATVEIDMTAHVSGGVATRETARVGALVDAYAGSGATNPTAVQAHRPVATRQTRATASVTAHSTSYRAAQARTKGAMPWNILASILAALALLFAFGAYQLLHSAPLAGVGQGRLTPGITATIAVTPQITAAPTATMGSMGTVTPAPTSPPAAFGRFDTATTTLQFICVGDSTSPQAITFDNNGTAPLTWSAHVIDTIGANEPWAAVSPASGTLTTAQGNAVTITVTPAADFCAATVPASFRLQFTAPDAVPLTIVATHTPSVTATTAPPTVTPTP